jgi:hypothetical protein
LLVHEFPSSQVPAIGKWMQPDAGRQESIVQVACVGRTVVAGPGTHTPAWQTSPTVQRLLSVQEPVRMVC